VLKSSPFVKNFYDRVIELERAIKGTIELIHDWDSFQKNWVYLDNIFSTQEIRRILNKESALF